MPAACRDLLRIEPSRYSHWAAIWLLGAFLVGVAACSSGPKTATSSAPPPSNFASQTIVTEQPGKALPPITGAVLVTVERWGSTAFALLGEQVRPLELSDPVSMDDNLVAQRDGKLAFLAMKGIDPGENHIEIAELVSRKRQQIKPAQGFTIFGFVFGPGADKLVYSEVGLVGSSSRQAPWRVVMADLGSGRTQLIAASGVQGLPTQDALIPFAWSEKTGDIYFRAVLPYGGGSGRGIWAMRPDGSQPRQILAQALFAGTPRLSPDGAYLAYLGWDQQLLPQGFGQVPRVGPMPANILTVMALATGKEMVLLRAKESALGALAWSGIGDEVVVTRQAWRTQEAFFTDAAIVAVARDGSGQRAVAALPVGASVSDLSGCAKGGELWVEKSPQGITVMTAGKGGSPRQVASFPEGRVRTVSCLN